MIRQQQSGQGLGSDIVLTLLTKDEAHAKSLFRLLWARIEGFEQRFSRFRPTSELSKVNEQAGSQTVVSPAFHDLLQAALNFSHQTNGLYNPLVLPALQRAGYVGSWPQPAKFSQQLDYRQRQVALIDDVVLHETTVKLPPASALDFGGIGKGYLLDELTDFLDTKHVKDYWLSLGGDIICGGFNLEQQPWQVGIARADQPEEIVRTITNPGGQRLAIATSGTTKRRGEGWHHIIDPRTGQPAVTDVLTATVIASTATAADVYAKCLVIIGSKPAAKLRRENNFTSAMLQTWHNETMQILEYGAAA